MEELNFRWEEDFPPEMLEHAWTCMFERDVLQREKAKAQALTLLNKEVGGGVGGEEVVESWIRIKRRVERKSLEPRLELVEKRHKKEVTLPFLRAALKTNKLLY